MRRGSVHPGGAAWTNFDGLRSVTRRQVLKGGAAVAALGGVTAFLAAARRRRATAAPAPARRRSRRPARRRAPASAEAPSTAVSGTSRSGRTTRTTIPKGVLAGIVDTFTKRPASRSRSTPSSTARSRTRSARTSRARRTTCSPGSRASGCGSSRPRVSRPTSATSGPRSATTTRDAFKVGSTGDDGKQYFIPIYNYPWAVFYRKSCSRTRATPSRRRSTSSRRSPTKMQADGLIPMAFGDSDGWPAMGTFDIINLRQNGYDFHVGLMTGGRSGPTRRPRRSSRRGRSCSRSTRRAPPAGRGRTPHRPWSRRRPACTCSGCSYRSSSRRPARPTSRTSTSSPIRTSAPSGTPRRRSTRRSTGS